MTVTYATAALVGKRSKYISTDLTTTAEGDIDQIIYQVEGFIDSVMRATARGASPDFTFDVAKHGIIRMCAIDYATYLCIIYDFVNFPSLDDAESAAALLWNSIAHSLTLLSDSRIIEYLKGS